MSYNGSCHDDLIMKESPGGKPLLTDVASDCVLDTLKNTIWSIGKPLFKLIGDEEVEFKDVYEFIKVLPAPILQYTWILAVDNV